MFEDNLNVLIIIFHIEKQEDYLKNCILIINFPDLI